MDIVDRCQIARDDMNLVHQLSGALANLQTGRAYLDNNAGLPPRLEREYQQMAEKLGQLEVTAQGLFTESERWLKRAESRATIEARDNRMS